VAASGSSSVLESLGMLREVAMERASHDISGDSRRLAAGGLGWIGSIGLSFSGSGFETDGIARKDRDGWFAELPVGPSLMSHWPPCRCFNK
jgi:hypothetical protein